MTNRNRSDDHRGRESQEEHRGEEDAARQPEQGEHGARQSDVQSDVQPDTDVDEEPVQQHRSSRLGRGSPTAGGRNSGRAGRESNREA